MILSFLNSFNLSYSQDLFFESNNSEIIRLLPRSNNGYLAWFNDENIDHWLIEIEESHFTNGSVDDVQLVFNKEVWREVYLKIPDEYYLNNDENLVYSCNLIGLSSTNAEIKRTIMNIDQHTNNDFILSAIGLIPRTKGCAWVCNGPNWAYRIQQWAYDGNAIYVLENASTTLPSGVEANYYEYMSTDYFNFIRTYDTFFWHEWYNVLFGDFLLHSNTNPNSPFYLIPYDDSYVNKDGYPFDPETADVVRVKKRKGIWADSYIYTDEIVNPNNFCVNELSGAIQLMNNPSSSNLPSLVDDGFIDELLYCAISSTVTPDEANGCPLPNMEIDYNGDGDINGWDILDYWSNDCVPHIPYVTFDFIYPFHSVSYIFVENVSNSEIPNVKIKGDDLFDEVGDFTFPDFPLSKGLNIINVIFRGGGERRVVVEINEDIDGSLNLSNFLDVTIFPVPISENSFFMNLVASTSLNFRYELYDFDQNLIYKMDYKLKVGHDENHLIQPNFIPEGMLINKFIFEDGSSISITTLKI